jgi:FMN phosphatase YigB (HAD superfamily)
MGKPRISLLVTDLDNTLYDWVTFFAHAFYDMVASAVDVLGVPEEILLDELREVHQRHHNTEHPYALLETRTVLTRFPGLSRSQRAALLDEPFHRFNKRREQILSLYPGVAETLEAVRSQDVAVVGHTEATVPNALFRLRKLGIDRFFDRIYAPAPSEPDDDSADAPFWVVQPPATIPVKQLARDERKPDPRILRDICFGMGVGPDQTLYVGDSIARDIGMAKEAGAWTAWAEYGTRYDPALWARLVRVTHWTAEDVARAEAAKKRHGRARPDVTLHQSLSEICRSFVFVPISTKRGTTDGEKAGHFSTGDSHSLPLPGSGRGHP